MRSRRQWCPLLVVLSVLGLPLATAGSGRLLGAMAASGPVVAPVAPPARICDGTLLSGPVSPPAGALVVGPGEESISTATRSAPAGTTFWLAPGTHRLGRAGIYDQVIPKNGNTYIGAAGAVIDGSGTARYAFTGHARDVTVKYLTIQSFGAAGTNNNQGVVNHDAATSWTIEFNTIQNNAGAGLFIGSNNVVRHNCLRNNEQYGFSMFIPPAAGGANAITNITIDHNEITGNNTYDWESRILGCGCSGGGKFWDVGGARVTSNWVHHNRGAGLWADTNNVDFLVEGNYIEENDGAGLFYELSYNALIRYNTFKRNAIKMGVAFQARGDNFPVGAIYVSESGGNARVNSTLTRTANLEIIGNSFENNWDGVVLWENADRFFNSSANTSGKAYVPKGGVASVAACNDPAAGGSIAFEPAYSDCRWRTKDVRVSSNTFSFDTAAVGCTAGFCGRNAVFSQYGTYPPWSPYKAWAVSDAITFAQGNLWSRNIYAGPWRFMAHDTGTTLDPSAWQGAPYNQDPGSTFTAGEATTPPGPITTVEPPVFASSLVPWFSARVSPSTSPARSPTGSARIDITHAYGWGLELSNWPGYAATPGVKTIGFSARLGAGSDLGVTMTVRWRDESGTDLKVDRVNIPRLESVWRRASAEVTAPPGTSRVWVELTDPAGLPGDHLYIDELVVRPSANHLDVDTADLESSTGSWAPWFSAGISRGTEQAASGGAHARVDIVARHGWGVELQNWPGFVATPGLKSISFSSRLGAGRDLGITMTVRWRDGAGTDLQVDRVTIPVLRTTWSEATASVVAPAGTERAWVTFTHESGDTGDSVYFDHVYVG